MFTLGFSETSSVNGPSHVNGTPEEVRDQIVPIDKRKVTGEKLDEICGRYIYDIPIP